MPGFYQSRDKLQHEAETQAWLLQPASHAPSSTQPLTDFTGNTGTTLQPKSHKFSLFHHFLSICCQHDSCTDQTAEGTAVLLLWAQLTKAALQHDQTIACIGEQHPLTMHSSPAPPATDTSLGFTSSKPELLLSYWGVKLVFYTWIDCTDYTFPKRMCVLVVGSKSAAAAILSEVCLPIPQRHFQPQHDAGLRCCQTRDVSALLEPLCHPRPFRSCTSAPRAVCVSAGNNTYFCPKTESGEKCYFSSFLRRSEDASSLAASSFFIYYGYFGTFKTWIATCIPNCPS